ncbi:MAG: nucleotidyltransferase domain-containing protein [Planctomycetota bacterium]|nr:nucleotidyltransferase domain-containing protein [Planctomycetota bacterium]
MLQVHGITFDLALLWEAARRSAVVRMYLFGSILTDQFGADSDIDFIVETDPLHAPGIFALGGLQMELSELLGRTVHLTLLGGVPARERSAVLARAWILGAA